MGKKRSFFPKKTQQPHFQGSDGHPSARGCDGCGSWGKGSLKSQGRCQAVHVHIHLLCGRSCRIWKSDAFPLSRLRGAKGSLPQGLWESHPSGRDMTWISGTTGRGLRPLCSGPQRKLQDSRAEQMDKLDFIKIKIICSAKGSVKRMKTSHRLEENICKTSI